MKFFLPVFLVQLSPGLEYTVDDFRNDFTGNASDTSQLLLTWGDSLFTGDSLYDLVLTTNPFYMNDGTGGKDSSSANPVVSASGNRSFSVAYISWDFEHTVNNLGAGQDALPADILMRSIIVNDNSDVIGNATVIAGDENPVNNGNFYSNLPFRASPSYLNFAADGASFAAYWTSLISKGPLRRTSDEDIAGETLESQFGKYVTPPAQEVIPERGTLGMGARPGSGANELVIAYESVLGGGSAQAEIRWENTALGTSTVQTVSSITNTFMMEDFAVAVDSSGTVFATWREVDVLYGVSYRNDQSLLMPVTQLEASVIYKEDGTAHTYRKYGVKALVDDNFIITYARGTSIYYKIIDVSTASLGPEVELTPGCGGCFFPNLDVSDNSVIFAWYGNTQGGNMRVEGSRFDKNGAGLIISSRLDLVLGPEDVAFNTGASGWGPWHNYRVPSVAINPYGDLAVAYDLEFGSRLAVWTAHPLYFDTSFFISGVIPISNPGISYTLDPATDSLEITSIVMSQTTGAALQLGLSETTDFSQPASDFFNISSSGDLLPTLKTNAGFFRYKILLDATAAANLTSPAVYSLNVNFNVKPRQPAVDSVQVLPGGITQAYNPSSPPDIISRTESLRVVASGFDLDNAGAFKFIFNGESPLEDTAPVNQGNGNYQGTVTLPPRSNSQAAVSMSVQSEDSLAWQSQVQSFVVNYINMPPGISASLIQSTSPGSGAVDTTALTSSDAVSIFSRDTATLTLDFSDGNDGTLNIQVLKNTDVITDTAGSVPFNLEVLLGSDVEEVSNNYQVRVMDADTTILFDLTVHYLNYDPQVTVTAMKTLNTADLTRDTLSITQGSTARMFARDSAILTIVPVDTNDGFVGFEYYKNDQLISNPNLANNQNYTISLYHDSESPGVEYRIVLTDPDTSVTFLFFVDYLNEPPVISATLVSHPGINNAGQFDPLGGNPDTLELTQGVHTLVHQGDIPSLALSFTDGLDKNLALEVFWDGNPVLDTDGITDTTYEVNFSADSQNDSALLQITAQDPDTQVELSLMVALNKVPVIDSILITFEDISIDRKANADFGTGLAIVPQVENVFRIIPGETDVHLNDNHSLTLNFLDRPEGCTVGHISCYNPGPIESGFVTPITVPANRDQVIMTLQDNFGAFTIDTIALVFPFLDTTTLVNTLFQQQVDNLLQDTTFVLGSSTISRQNQVILINSGSGILGIDSVATGENNETWMSYQLNWIDPNEGKEELNIENSTHENKLVSAVEIYPGNFLTITFNFSAENLSGDFTLTDTLYLKTTDFQNPILKIPYQFIFADLPTVNIFARTASGNSSKAKRKGPPDVKDSLEVRSEIVFAFSEPILLSTVDSAAILIYSQLDSAKNDRIDGLPSLYDSYFLPTYHTPPGSSENTSLADTLVFSPMYRQPADSLGVRPGPGNFIRGDIIKIQISNQITDSVGNALDLSFQKIVVTPGSDDSLFSFNIDPSVLQITSTVPSEGSDNFNPQDPIEIHFNKPIVHDYFHDSLNSNIHSIDTLNLMADTNLTVNVTSTGNLGMTYQIRYLRLTNNNSTLLIKVTPNFYTRDSVTLTLSNRISDGSGLTMDGNGDGLGKFWYDPNDRSDIFTLNFTTRPEPFYLFPNPFRWSRQAHTDKGSVTFKNLTSLSGVNNGTLLEFKVHTMTGDLVYSSDRKGENKRISAVTLPIWDWDLKNNHEKNVGTGVYIFSVHKKNGKMLKKGKIAVIR